MLCLGERALVRSSPVTYKAVRDLAVIPECERQLRLTIPLECNCLVIRYQISASDKDFEISLIEENLGIGNLQQATRCVLQLTSSTQKYVGSNTENGRTPQWDNRLAPHNIIRMRNVSINGDKTPKYKAEWLVLNILRPLNPGRGRHVTPV